MTLFPHLFEPLKLGAHTVRNRLFFPPHGTSLGDQGIVGDRMSCVKPATNQVRAKRRSFSSACQAGSV